MSRRSLKISKMDKILFLIILITSKYLRQKTLTLAHELGFVSF